MLGCMILKHKSDHLVGLIQPKLEGKLDPKINNCNWIRIDRDSIIKPL